MEDVVRFRGLLEAANGRTNLVGSASLAEFWTRHFLDSAQLIALAPQARLWADLGSGAGFPGLVLAILLADRPGVRIHLVDSRRLRCEFLADVVAALDLPAQVHLGRAEATPLCVEVVTARALAPLPRLLALAEPSLKPGVRGLFLKGAEVDSELAEARKSWRFELTIHPSLSDPRGRILDLTELARVR